MSVNISYMGTKREFAPAVADVISNAQEGTVLDVFAGMCSVGEALQPFRQVWANDVQKFAFEVATAVFTDCDFPLCRNVVSDILFDDYQDHKNSLEMEYVLSIDLENNLLECGSFEKFELLYQKFKSKLSEEKETFSKEEFFLFTSRYADTYFGLQQVIQIDSILSAIRRAYLRNDIRSDHRRWLTIALGRAMLRTANSTGHFAQYLKPKVGSFKTFLRQRRRDLWFEWLSSLEEMAPVGTVEWRAENRTFNMDCSDLMDDLLCSDIRPSVIYADPPYTDDQYSRYYHILETLVMYDYPDIVGAGLYRTDRFRTPYSLRSRVAESFERLVKKISMTGADIVLSYPTNGLMYEVGCDPLKIMKKHFRVVERCYAISHDHSTFGASKGSAKAAVTEQIFLGRA
ncbi:MAG: DNA adenine methylase [Nisaea sp.]|uniref:DNA adenine methylase n=1 Tax=Nisaea sp. TaxID=2024842 RepID=UPI001B1426C6|nr:DNA adenine methylase [Nisaea sp.]MBO6559268.1 DNA adenine methylase [Nisaea sp.]